MSWLRQFFSTGGGAKEMSVQELHGVVRQAKNGTAPYLLDVREDHEFSGGHIAGARLIPLSDLGRRLDEIPRDRTVVCICRSGRRSGIAANQLVQAGFEDVYNMNGGMMAWNRMSYPLQKGK
jgi:rhodanese-related sulfurtransferase